MTLFNKVQKHKKSHAQDDKNGSNDQGQLDGERGSVGRVKELRGIDPVGEDAMSFQRGDAGIVIVLVKINVPALCINLGGGFMKIAFAYILCLIAIESVLDDSKERG
jgi:hypothetical protein